MTALLDNPRIGVLELDRRGRILAANDRAHTLLRHGDGLVDRKGMLRARAVGRQGRDIQRPNVPVWAKTEVPLIDVGQIGVGLTCKDAFMPKALEGDVKAAEAGEKIDKTESSRVFIT